jgi:transposase-like protein/IS1 family transposase
MVVEQTNQPVVQTMTCAACGAAGRPFGRHRNGLRRFRCPSCKKTFTEAHERPFRVEDYLQHKRGILALKLLLEGSSVRTVERVTGIRHASILSLLVLMGERCDSLMGAIIQDVPVTDVQVDEIWHHIFCKEAHKGPEDAHNDSIGDSYTFVGIERNTKLVLAWHVGRRTRQHTETFLEKLRRATSDDTFQLTSDGFGAYRDGVIGYLGDRVNYAQLIKSYLTPHEGHQRYSPGKIINTEVVPVCGNPDRARICTSHVERQNLTMRTNIRRFTRLSMGFSKKLENHRAAVSLWFAYYNLCRTHTALRITPAMEAGLTDHVWSLPELIAASARVQLPAVA